MIGIYPATIDVEFIHLTGTIVTWWARTEGIIIKDLRPLRSLPINAKIASQEKFPAHTKRAIKHWGKLLRNAYSDSPDELEKLAKIQQTLFELLEHRNSIVHSFWPYGQTTTGEIILSSVRPGKGDEEAVIYTSYETTIDEMNEINNKMAHIYHHVMAFSFNSHKLYRQPQTKADKDAG